MKLDNKNTKNTLLKVFQNEMHITVMTRGTKKLEDEFLPEKV